MTSRTVAFLDTANSNSPGGYRAPGRGAEAEEEQGRFGSSGSGGGGGGRFTPQRERPARNSPISAARSVLEAIELERVLPDPEAAAPEPVDPKGSLKHLQAHGDNMRIASEARQITARVASKYPDIARALFNACGVAGRRFPAHGHLRGGAGPHEPGSHH